MSLRLTQIPAEIAADASASSRLSQGVAEVIADLPILSNCRLTQICAEVLSDFVRPTQLIGGNFQDLEGNPLNGGKLTIRINSSARSPINEQLSTVLADIPLDTNGSVLGAALVWGNSILTPTDTRYFLTGYSAAGQLVWGRWCVTIPVADTYDLTTLVPQNS